MEVDDLGFVAQEHKNLDGQQYEAEFNGRELQMLWDEGRRRKGSEDQEEHGIVDDLAGRRGFAADLADDLPNLFLFPDELLHLTLDVLERKKY